MSTPTSKLGLPKPAGNELNNRAGYNAVLDQIDAAAMKDIFYCKTAVYNSGTSKIDVTIGPGVISFLQIVVNKTVDTVYSISSPAINTSYYVYLSSAGAFSSNTTGAEVDGAVMLWKISTGAALTAISTLDLRGIVNGSAQMVKDLLDSYQSTNDSAVALKAPLASPVLTGTPSAPTAAANTNTTQLATTAFVEAARVILAAADAAKAPLASPALTGTPTAPTASPGTNTTQLATTAFVEAARAILAASDASKAPMASPALTGIPTAPTAAYGTNTTQLATTAFGRANFPLMSNSDTTYYVLKTGSDSNTGLANAAGGAFLTITKAISMIPQICNHTYTINVGAGTYNEDVTISGFSGKGTITLSGATAQTDTYIVNLIIVRKCSILITVKGFKSTTAAADAFYVEECMRVEFFYLKADGSTPTMAGIRVVSAKVYSYDSSFSNKGYALKVALNGELFSYSNVGTANFWAFSATEGGRISKIGSEPTGTSGSETANGGMIIPIEGVLKPWGDNNSAVSKAGNGYQKLPSGLIIQWGLNTIATGLGGQTITFPIAFPTACVTATATINGGAGQTVGTMTSTTAVTVTHSYASPLGIYWVAIGY